MFTGHPRDVMVDEAFNRLLGSFTDACQNLTRTEQVLLLQRLTNVIMVRITGECLAEERHVPAPPKQGGFA